MSNVKMINIIYGQMCHLSKVSCSDHIALVLNYIKLMLCTYRPHITAYIHQKSIMYNITYHTTAKCVSATNMPLKCHAYATCPNYSMLISGESMPIHMPYMNSLV